MNSHPTKFLLLAVMLFLFARCSKDISVPLPGEPVRPVLNAILSKDSVIYARATLSDRLERTFPTGNPAGFTAPEDAVVTLFEEGQYIETLGKTLIYNQLFFVSNSKVQAGKHYSLKLQIPGYPIAEAGDVIPDNNTFALSDQRVFMTGTSYGYDETNLSFTLTNKDNRSNYYLLRLFSLRAYTAVENGDTVVRYARQMVWIDYRHRTPQVLGGNSRYQYMGLLSERPVAAAASSLFTLNAGNQLSDTMLLEVSVLTNSCYLYMSTFEKAMKTMDDPTAEKMKVYNNVSNGFGIVGGMATSSYLFIR